MTYSHMGEPHYHWRYDVSLLSSVKDQLLPIVLLLSIEHKLYRPTPFLFTKD